MSELWRWLVQCRCPTPSALRSRCLCTWTAYGTGTIPDKEILQAVLKNFDFRPGDLHPLACQARLS